MKKVAIIVFTIVLVGIFTTEVIRRTLSEETVEPADEEVVLELPPQTNVQVEESAALRRARNESKTDYFTLGEEVQTKREEGVKEARHDVDVIINAVNNN